MKGFSEDQYAINFGKYMKDWRFREIRSVIAQIMCDDAIKDTGP